ncbi:MAG: glycosyltransferase family 4 protein [Chloroflexi bacterium]|nr:glycosyltransferase family 4 protein [Chloroflexota bacterium]
MRVVVIGRTYILEANRAKWTYLPPDANLTLVTPPMVRHPLKVYCAEPSTCWPHFLVPAWGTGRLSGFAFHPWRLWPVLRRIKPDLIQVDEEPLSPALLEVLLLKRQLKCPIIFFSWENLPIRPRWPFSLARRFNLRRADGAIAGTEEAAQRLREAGFVGPIATIPQLGVDPQVFRPSRNEALRQQLGLRTFTIGYMGRIVPEKGLWVLLDALATLSGDWQCLLVGEGLIRAEWLKQAGDRGLARRVIWVPTVPHSAVPDYINTMDVLVLPSLMTPRWKEQFGHVLIEAMACQVPVIGSDAGAIPEVIGDAGIVVPEGDPNTLALAVKQLYLSEAERAALGRKGRERVLAYFTNERIAQRTWFFWQEILDARGSVR